MNKNIIASLAFILALNFNTFSQDYESKISVNGDYDEQRLLEVETYFEGNKIYSIRKTLKPNYSIPETVILNNGFQLQIHSLEGVIELYNTNEQLLLKKDFYKLPPYNEQIIKYAINNVGVVILVSENQKNNIYLIENSGVIKDSLKVEDGLVSGVGISENGKFLAYSIMNWKKDELENKTFILDLENKSSVEYKIKFEKCSFNITNKIFLGFTNRNSVYIDLTAEKILWEKTLPNDQIYVDGIIEHEKTILVQSTAPKLIDQKWVYENINVLQKDTLGNEVLLSEINESVNKVKLIRSENKILIKSDSGSTQLNLE